MIEKTLWTLLLLSSVNYMHCGKDPEPELTCDFVAEIDFDDSNPVIALSRSILDTVCYAGILEGQLNEEEVLVYVKIPEMEQTVLSMEGEKLLKCPSGNCEGLEIVDTAYFATFTDTIPGKPFPLQADKYSLFLDMSHWRTDTTVDGYVIKVPCFLNAQSSIGIDTWFYGISYNNIKLSYQAGPGTIADPKVIIWPFPDNYREHQSYVVVCNSDDAIGGVFYFTAFETGEFGRFFLKRGDEYVDFMSVSYEFSNRELSLNILSTIKDLDP